MKSFISSIENDEYSCNFEVCKAVQKSITRDYFRTDLGEYQMIDDIKIGDKVLVVEVKGHEYTYNADDFTY
ncbi:MAG: hypothetical protein E6686_03565 [Lachnospiraceae bacterium]|nr:hypothetical protein [Lachnospiraceae bacterium]